MAHKITRKSYSLDRFDERAVKNYINIEITKNFVKTCKAHFEKKLLNKARMTCILQIMNNFKIDNYGA